MVLEGPPVLTLAALLFDVAKPRTKTQIIPAYTVPALHQVFINVIRAADKTLSLEQEAKWRNRMHKAVEKAAKKPLVEWMRNGHTEELRDIVLAAADQALQDQL